LFFGMSASLTHWETPVIRLFVSGSLAAGVSVAVTPEQSHFLANVMRLRSGDRLAVFNGVDGEWEASVEVLGKRKTRLQVGTLLRGQACEPDLELVVALVKRTRLETIVEKATELGARRLRLVITERTNADHTNVARLRSIAIEATEQCGRLGAPDVLEPAKLTSVLDGWDRDRRLMFCDEAGDAAPAAKALTSADQGPWAILIGPEGGFSPTERARIRALPGTLPVSLGPRILRADTATIVALALWQSALGDWRGA
jgi:16S rRNA (uracil1498-N3)-methyltransferase